MQTTVPAPQAMQAPDVCVVIVTYNGAPWISRCLDSLLPPVAGRGVQIVVVDNASTDDTCALIERDYPQVVLIRSPGNLGFGRGNNLGIAHALAQRARHVFLLNQDAYVLPGAIAALADFMDAHPEIGAASPLHCSPDPEHADPRTLRGYLQRYATDYLADACMGRQQPFYLTHGVNAAAWFVRAEVWQRCGGFDPLFFMYCEDDDLLTRWKHHGVPFALLPGARIVHLRESVQGPRVGWWGQVLRRARRQRADLLHAMKRPGFSTAHTLSVLLADGFLAPLATLALRRDLQDYAASLVAALQMIAAFRSVRRHARLSATTGAHFL